MEFERIITISMLLRKLDPTVSATALAARVLSSSRMESGIFGSSMTVDISWLVSWSKLVVEVGGRFSHFGRLVDGVAVGWESASVSAIGGSPSGGD